MPAARPEDSEVAGMLETLAAWGRLVRFSHGVFALPFALAGAALASAASGPIPWSRVLWIVVAMLGARNAAMGFNRLVDERYDAANPRTAARELPAGRLSRRSVWVMTVALALLFVVAAFALGPLCGALSPLALLIVFGYSYSKRFSWASHLWLGLALATAPVGGWLAVAGSFAVEPWLLALAVLCWVAGFDVIYACQDVEFDRRAGLRSIPARFGVARALVLARLLHLAAVAALAAVGLVAELHAVYWAGWLVIAALLAWEHRLVRADDLSRVGAAFFNMNGVIAVVYLVTVLLAVWSGSVPFDAP
jgi:4-hydroxybenzoate polyprenyltransferase